MPNGSSRNAQAQEGDSKIEVALLTGGGDRPYAYGLTMELISRGVGIDLIGSDDLDFPDFRGKAGLNFLNLRGSQKPEASLVSKITRISLFYVKLLRYVIAAKPKIFHILWNNKFQFFDRTLLTLYYRLLGKKIILTVHKCKYK